MQGIQKPIIIPDTNNILSDGESYLYINSAMVAWCAQCSGLIQVAFLNSRGVLQTLLTSDMLAFHYNATVHVLSRNIQLICESGEIAIAVLVYSEAISSDACVTIAPYRAITVPIGIVIRNPPLSNMCS